MPRKPDLIRFQTSGPYGVDTDRIAEKQPEVNQSSAEAAGFANPAEERIDMKSRTLEGTSQLRLKGEEPVNSPNAQIDATKQDISPAVQREKIIKDMDDAYMESLLPPEEPAA